VRRQWRRRYRRLGSDVVWPGGSKEAPLPENVLRIGVLLPQTGSWYAGRTILGAARLAVDDINNDPTLLGGYVAELKWRDAGCAAPQGIAAMSAMLEDKNIGAVIGPGMSSASVRRGAALVLHVLRCRRLGLRKCVCSGRAMLRAPIDLGVARRLRRCL